MIGLTGDRQIDQQVLPKICLEMPTDLSSLLFRLHLSELPGPAFPPQMHPSRRLLDLSFAMVS